MNSFIKELKQYRHILSKQTQLSINLRVNGIKERGGDMK